MLRSLSWYRRQHLALAAAVAVATAVLAGALVVGDSVRGSLRELALSRLGRIERVVVAERPFREELAADWRARGGGDAAAALVARGSARHGEAGRRASGVTVLGVDEAWATLFPETPLDLARGDGQAFPSVLLGEALARELGAAVGDAIELRVPTHSAIPRETLIGREEALATIATLRLSVAGVLPERGLGGFRLDAGQGPSLIAVVERGRLARAVDARGRANLLAAAGGSRAAGALSDAVTLEDLGLLVTPRDGEVVLESERLVMDDDLVARLHGIARETGARPRAVYTYLANRIRRIPLSREGGGEVPYSTVAALDSTAGLETLEGVPVPSLPPGTIAVNAWAAEQLGAAAGDELELAYFVVGPRDELIEHSARFRVAAVVAMRGLGADPSLTPELPGLSDADRMSDWDPPFPVDLGRIRPADEAYWQSHRAAPKAFVSLAEGRALWGSRFGAVSSLRLAPPAGTSTEELARALSERIPRGLPPAEAGLAVREVRADAFAAGEGATSFSALFLAFSMFLLAAALLLVGLLERLAVETRAREIGLLGAVGFPAAAVRRRLLVEAGAVSALGVLVGLAGAVGWGALMLHGLRTWWVGAVGSPVLELHARISTLAAGGALALLVVGATLALAVARLSRAPAAALLAGGAAAGAGRVPRGGAARWVAAAALSLGAVAVAGAARGPETTSAAFSFAAGALTLVGAIAAVATPWGAGTSRPPRAFGLHGPAWLAMGARNGGRNRGRALLVEALVACATFVLTVVAVNRAEAETDPIARESGTGGFALVAESDVPIVEDLGRPEAREELGLGEDAEAALAGVAVVPFRLLPGEDASCLNLYQPTRPRVLGAPPEMLARGGFRFQSLARETDEPWALLEEDLGEGIVPAFADANSAVWILKKGLGDDVELLDESGRPLRLRLVGLLARSLFQSELVIAESAFVRRFPSRAGASFFLVETPPGRAEEVAAALETGLERFGFDASSTVERLRAYAAVESTYLATFQALGGLGLLLGTVGLGVVLLRNVVERRRELAMLSALGFRRARLSALVLAENLVLLALGLALGVGAALVATAPHLAMHAERVPWGSLAITLAAVLAVGCLASLGAVAATSRTPLLPALKSE